MSTPPQQPPYGMMAPLPAQPYAHPHGYGAPPLQPYGMPAAPPADATPKKKQKEWLTASADRLLDLRTQRAFRGEVGHALSLESLEQDDDYVSESQRKKAVRANSLGGANCPLAAGGGGGPSDVDLKAKVQQLELEKMKLEAKVSAFETHLMLIIKIVPSLLQWFVGLKAEQKEDMPPSITNLYKVNQTGRGIVDNN